MSIFRRSKDRTPAPVKIAWARNQAEAEMIEQILDQEGIPCLIRRDPGMDVADFLAAGARQVYVPANAAEQAQQLLADLQAGGEKLPDA